MFKKIVALLLVSVSLLADIREKMCADLDTIKGIFETQYAPAEWKASYAGWDLESEIEFAKARVISTPDITVKDYQSILRDFCKSTQDYHVTVTFYSTASASLPLAITSAAGRYFVTAVDQEGKIQVGDEILFVNGQPIEEAMLEFQIENMGPGASPSDLAMRESFFTKRYGHLGHHVPQGEVFLELKSKKGKKKRATLQWEYQAEGVKPFHFPKVDATFQWLSFKKRIEIPYKCMLTPYHKFLAKGLGDRESYLPPLGKKIWSTPSDSPFHAYLFETKEGRYGYVRIPEFMGSSHELAEFKKLIAKFEAESKALVIDQLSNPGGSVYYMYALLSTLTDKPLLVPKHRIAITPKEIFLGLELIELAQEVNTDEEAGVFFGDVLDGFPATADTVRGMASYHQFLISQWNLGVSFTPPFPLMGLTEIAPDAEVRYTKPILVLINALDFSCADFFPSILQDNQRATLFGTATGGAGGFVLKASYPNRWGVEEITYTGSIAYRDANLPIENLGVEPNIPCQVTVEDFLRSYTPYKEKVLHALRSIAK